MNKTRMMKCPCKKILEAERENSPPVDVKKYKSLLGSLLYVAIKTRPDIAFAVNQASRYYEQPKEINYKSLMMILQYLNSTKDKLVHNNGETKLIGYSDSDYANDENTRRSTSGYIYLIRNSPISWKSQLQRIVTLSTAEAEFVSLTECAKQGIWMKNLIQEVTKNKIRIKIKVDNKACIVITEDENAKGRCKHIDTRYKYIQERIKENDIKLEYVRTDDILVSRSTY